MCERTVEKCVVHLLQTRSSAAAERPLDASYVIEYFAKSLKVIGNTTIQ